MQRKAKRNKETDDQGPKYIVSNREVIQAFEAWYRIMNRDRGDRPYADPWVFMGDTGLTTHRNNYVVSANVYEKLRILTSEHARTLLKAWAIRTGYHKEIP